MYALLHFLAGVLLLVPCLFWLIEDAVRRAFKWPCEDNCFTWAMRNWRYRKDIGLVITKSRSSWFPHISLIRFDEDYAVRIEYVPINRLNLKLPPRKFKGRVVETVFDKVSQP